MITEIEVLFHVHDIQRIVVIHVLQVLQNIDLDHTLLLESFLASDYLHSHMLFSFMVEALEHLAKAALAERLEYFVSICNVILDHFRVGTILVIVVFDTCRLDFLGIQTEKPDFRILINFTLFKLREFITVYL